MKEKRFMRVLAILLSVCMTVSLLPTRVFAAESDFVSQTHDVFKSTESTLAPGINQKIKYAYAKDGKQMVYYVTTADVSREDVVVQTSYLKQHEKGVLGMEKLTKQMAYAKEKYSNPDDEHFISKYYTPVAGVNASFYNMTTGQPTGITYIDGVSFGTKAYNNFFAILKDGSAVIDYADNESKYTGDKAIEQAVAGSEWIVREGKDVTVEVSGDYNKDRHSRTCVGITKDGKVVTMVLDGRQEPFSCGGNMHELAQIMLEQGCVSAINLDGGGSTTYAARQEGENDVEVINRPSDGSERSISAGLIIASTAAPSNVFDHATLKAEENYVTPNSEVKVTATGVSPAGTAADIPENAEWKIADSKYGKVEDGVFISNGTTGDVKVQMVVDGNVVGETTIHVVIPDKIAFSSDNITIPFSKTVKLKLSATYGLNKVAIKESDIKFEFDKENAVTMDGFNATACEESAGIAETNVTATLVHNKDVQAQAKITLGKGSEVKMDFEDGDISSLNIATGYLKYGPSGANGQNEIGHLNVVTKENGQVHNGDKSLAVECDYSQIYETGYHLLNLTGLSIKVPAKATAVGMWIYLPELEEIPATAMRFLGNTEGSNKNDVSSPYLWDNGYTYGWKNDGWRYVTMDLTGYNKDLTINCIQFYISDRDNSKTGYYFKDHASVNGRFTYYIDDITVDYSSSVADREAPVFSNIKYADNSMSDAVELKGQTVKNNEISFSANVTDNEEKDNYTGIDDKSAKATIDGVAVDFKYSNGKFVISDIKLADGVHTVRFEIADMNGNSAYVTGQIKIDNGSDQTNVTLNPADPDADKILIGSIYWMNLETSKIENINTIKTVLNLNSMSTWQLEHMEVAPGFESSYKIDEVTNNATITIKRVGDVKATGKAVIAKLPIRTWESKLTQYKGYEDQTPEKLWERKIIWPIDIKLSSYVGDVSLVDGTKTSFSMSPISVLTELYGNYAKLNENGDYANKKSWHQHTKGEATDKKATCTEDGYTGRVFCTVCNSPVEWGTTIKATGHSYELVDGKLKCSSCGDFFNGEWEDGKTYADGVTIKDGWNGESYYKDGKKLTGLQKIDGYYYDFGENGICSNKAKLDGFYYDKEAKAYRYFIAGEMETGEVSIYPRVYFFDENGYAISGDVDILGYKCNFSEKGEFISSDNKDVVDAGYCGTNIKYVLLSNGTLKVDGEGKMKAYTANGIYPAWVIKNEPQKITNIEIGNKVTEIGKFAFFKNGYVKSIKFEANSSLKKIGWGAFGHCWRLANVTIPASVEVLDSYAFYECGALKSFNVAEGSKLESIGDYAFMHDIGIESVYIPDSVTKLGVGILAKANSSAVLNVVENSIAHLYAKENNLKFELRKGVVNPLYSGKCTDSITWALYPDGTLELKGSGAMGNYTSHTQQPWASHRDKIKKVVIGKDITTVGNYAFAYSQNIESIEFEEGSKLTSIGIVSFMNTPKVKEVKLPESVTYLGAYAFGDCFALENVYIPQAMDNIYYTAFQNSTKVTLNVAKGTYSENFAKEHNIKYETREFEYIPTAEGKCGENATWQMFENGELRINGSGKMENYTSHTQQPWASYRHKIKKVIIGKDITTVGNYAFAYSQNIESIEFEEGSKLTSIGIVSFMNTPKVKEVKLPESVTYLGAYAFGDCFALENVYIPQGVNSIYSTAFKNSDKVTLSVAEGTYAENFAKKNNIKYAVR